MNLTYAIHSDLTVPEPATLALLAFGLAGVCVSRAATSRTRRISPKRSTRPPRRAVENNASTA